MADDDAMATDAADAVNSDASTAADATTQVDAKADDGATGTVLDAKDQASETKADVKPDWPDDWRDKLAKGDEKTRKRLDRFQSPADVLKSWQALEQKLSSGDVKAKLPDDATEEQIAAYRKDNGIPEKPEGYLESLPNGLVIGDEDKPMVASFLEAVHGDNAPPGVVAKALDWYYKTQEETAAKVVETDKEYERASDDALRAEWGNEYRANVNSINSFLSGAPAADDGTPLADLLKGARLADGTAMMNNPAALKWLASLAHDANPAGFVAPGVAGSQVDGVKAEIEKIKKVMWTDRKAYDKDNKMQERLRQLYDAEEKLSR